MSHGRHAPALINIPTVSSAGCRILTRRLRELYKQQVGLPVILVDYDYWYYGRYDS